MAVQEAFYETQILTNTLSTTSILMVFKTKHEIKSFTTLYSISTDFGSRTITQQVKHASTEA